MTAIADISLIGLKDAETRFRVSYTTIYEAVRAGDLPAIKPFGHWLVKPQDVLDWLVEKDAERGER